MLAHLLRNSAIGRPCLWAPASVMVTSRMCSAMRPDDLRGNSKMFDVWDQVLRSAQSSPEKLRDIVDTLTKHCVITNTAPPLDSYNELLRICHVQSDFASIQKLVHMGYTVNMHFDNTTLQRFHSSFNLESSHNYFAHPFTGLASNSSSNTVAGAGVEAGAGVHGGYSGTDSVQRQQHHHHQQQQHGVPPGHPQQQQQQHAPRTWQVYGKPGTHGGRMDD